MTQELEYNMNTFHFPIFFNRKNFFSTNSSKNVNKGVHYRLVNQNTLSDLDEMLALTNFDDIISVRKTSIFFIF